jgi:hypothetical protein
MNESSTGGCAVEKSARENLSSLSVDRFSVIKSLGSAISTQTFRKKLQPQEPSMITSAGAFHSCDQI